MTRVCVVGSVNMDLVFTVEALPGPGATVLASTLLQSPGGKGGNQAIAAARAGAQVSFVGAVGSDAAAADLLAHLEDNGVDTAGVAQLPMPSGTAGIIVDGAAENMIVVAAGANAHLSLNSPQVRDVVAGCEVLLVQLEIPVETALTAARIARDAGAVVVLNASPVGADPTILAQLAELTDLVIVNETEARQWGWPVPNLVTTLGARGATLRTASGEVHVGAPEVEPVDTTGAGDVFAGVLAAGWPDGAERALRRAGAAGALATLVPGAGDCAPTDEAIEDALG
ncbi:ribokinase [Mycolicibacterium bacteremicum]|uniref:Ribokinase n=1 Tax=Mycolicibacterium bacteremicum TaxID=564198 RepID=A0A1W9Z2A3_MYCBA|nr:ribokinase [Mycolicibacterium bacteremicum]MCV7433280.1 ribokinase [Mycolicibacterium bacteremicum]ORA06413.1 ribokinase [Mycolicibacterium bacteremicum]